MSREWYCAAARRSGATRWHPAVPHPLLLTRARPPAPSALRLSCCSEAGKYTQNSRIQAIQTAMAQRCLELLALPDDDQPRFLLDIGCGSGLSGGESCGGCARCCGRGGWHASPLHLECAHLL